MTERPTTRDAYQLIHQGSLALAQVMSNGMRVDVDRINRTMEELAGEIKRLETELVTDKVYKTWEKRFGEKTKLGSREQLSKVLFENLGVTYPWEEKTKSGRYRCDEATLAMVDIPFVQTYTWVEKLRKVRNTSLKGIKDELVGEYLYPNYNLHIARSHRSSSDLPNSQNWPIRDPRLGEYVRSCFIARDEHVLLEVDFKALEVCLAAVATQDPVLMSYVKDSTKDMHRDTACQLFFLKPKQVVKPVRFAAKGKFVFAQFYGDWYKHCAKGLWDEIHEMKLATAKGTSLLKILAKNGIDRLGACDPKRDPEAGTFEAHVQSVERDFWGNRFKVYAEWKKTVWEDYRRTGYFDLLTGFHVEGVYEKNQTSNYPVQGIAFHCCLWVLTQVQKWLRRNKMRTKLVGQIHDSLNFDAHRNEWRDVHAKVVDIVTHDLPRHWPWINVPLTVEAEVAPESGSWWDKKPVEVVV